MKRRYLFIILFFETISAFSIPSQFHRITRKNVTIQNKFQNIPRLRPFCKQQSDDNANLEIKQTAQLPISWSKEKGLMLFDIQTTADIWAIILVYFIQGLLGISRLALSFYYKDMLHLSPADLSMISSISVLPWVIKPIYGFISDTYPFLGYKRKSYLMLSGFLSSISWGALAIMANQISSNTANVYNTYNINDIISSILLVTISSFGIAFSDVLVDAIVVTKSRLDPTKSGSLQSLSWSSSALGGFISAIFSGYLVQNFGSAFVFGITAVIPLIMVVGALLIKEDKIDKIYNTKQLTISNNTKTINKLNFKTQMNNVWQIVKQRHILSPLLFLVLCQIMPSSGSSLLYFQVNELGFQPEFLGKLGLISSVSSIVGITIYNQKLKTVPLRSIFQWTCILGTILGMTPLMLITHMNRNLGLSDAWFAIGDDIILTILGQIAFMPVLVLAAKMCPEGVEAMLYATLMSIFNLTGSIGGLFSAMLTNMMGITDKNFTNLPILIVITNLTGLIPLLFLHLIPDDSDSDNDQKKL
jgi:folate/biopterin transporter